PVHQFGYGRRNGTIRARCLGFPDDYELFWMGIGQGTIEKGVQDAEDRAVGRDAQGQRQYDYDKETGILQETANRDAHIQPDRLEQSQDSHVRVTSPARPAIRSGPCVTSPYRSAKRITSHACYAVRRICMQNSSVGRNEISKFIRNAGRRWGRRAWR